MTLHLTILCNAVVLMVGLAFIGLRTCTTVKLELRNRYNCKLVSIMILLCVLYYI